MIDARNGNAAHGTRVPQRLGSISLEQFTRSLNWLIFVLPIKLRRQELAQSEFVI
jgi:hypothetical protein